MVAHCAFAVGGAVNGAEGELEARAGEGYNYVDWYFSTKTL